MKLLFKKLRPRLGLLKRKGFRYRSIMGYTQIDGWFSENEAVMLYDVALALPNTHPIVVEIGSWLGKSTLVLAKALKKKRSPVLYCIDPFNCDGDAISRDAFATLAANLKGSLQKHFVRNMKKHRVLDVIRILAGYSMDFAPGFPELIDLLFIDANHEYDAVLRDYMDWAPLLKAGGIIALHDVILNPTSTDYHRGPGLVAKQHIIGNPEWAEVKLVDGLLIAKKVSACNRV